MPPVMVDVYVDWDSTDALSPCFISLMMAIIKVIDYAIVYCHVELNEDTDPGSDSNSIFLHVLCVYFVGSGI